VVASRPPKLPHNDPPSRFTIFHIPKAAGRATTEVRVATTKAEAGEAREDRTPAAPTKARRTLAGVTPTPPPAAAGATTTLDRTEPIAPGAATTATMAPAGATTITALRAAAATIAPGAATTLAAVVHGAPPRTTARRLGIRRLGTTTITMKAVHSRARMVSTIYLQPWLITTSSLRCRVPGVIPLPLLQHTARLTLTGDARLR
jgi:hypothetical protein